MTLLPHENRNVKGLEGPSFPIYNPGPLCSNPLCSRPSTQAHHLWRRSFLAGPYAWVELWDGKIVGNLSPICTICHLAITDGEAQIVWTGERFLWLSEGEIIAPLSPQPPIHGAPIAPVTRHSAPGPAAVDRCNECGRPLPHAHDDEKKEPARRRKTWVVTVPDDAQEDGALTLDVLLDCCRDLFGHDKNTHTRFVTLAQALALVVQNGHLLTTEEAE